MALSRPQPIARISFGIDLAKLKRGIDSNNGMTRRSAFTGHRSDPLVSDPVDCLRAAEQLLIHGQAWRALDLVAHYVERVQPSAVLS